jgi:hypothetical protein
MKNYRHKILTAAALVGALTLTSANAQQFPIPTTAAEVPGPAAGTTMTQQYEVTALATTFAAAQTEPLGGQPPPGIRKSMSDLEAQLAYQRAFEAVLWAMPASAIYRFRIGMLQASGMADNVIAASVTPLATKQEFITPNQTTPYTTAVSDLRNGPVVLEVPAKTDKVVLYGQIVDAWQSTIVKSFRKRLIQ